jgi:hypothetical protein
MLICLLSGSQLKSMSWRLSPTRSEAVSKHSLPYGEYDSLYTSSSYSPIQQDEYRFDHSQHDDATDQQETPKRLSLGYADCLGACWFDHLLLGVSDQGYLFAEKDSIVPESPWYYAKRDNKEGAMKSLRQLYGNVPGFDFEEEYGIIRNTVLYEMGNMDSRPRLVDVFRGTNLVRLRIYGLG